MNPLTPVAKVMSTDLITVRSSATITEMVDLFERHEIEHLPVVASDRTLEGIISQSDLLKALGKTFAELADVRARDIMTSGLAKVEPTTTVGTAAGLFMLNRFHALPVIEGDRIVGIVTTLDLIKLIDTEEVELADYAPLN